VRDANPSGVRSNLAASTQYQKHLARFLENHDENRCAAVFPDMRLIAAGTLTSTLPGMRFYYQDELDGRKVRLPITLQRAPAEPPNPAIRAFFDKILKITNGEIFHNGEWSLLPILPEDDDTSGNLALPVAFRKGVDHVSPQLQYDFFDALHEVHYSRNGE